jgi:MoxR-like ATPase
MSLYIQKGRLSEAIVRLSDWKGQVQSQGVNHLFPFLSLLRKGVGSEDFTKYEESDDRDFFEKYFKVKAKEGYPYFDPLNRKFRIATHPHSNAATLRKNTFANRWSAATSEVRADGTYWKLSTDAADILSERAMTRAGVTRRANLVDFAIWLFRDKEFPDDANSDTLLTLFRSTFPMSDADFNKLFEYSPEAPEHLYGGTHLSLEDVAKIALNLDMGDDRTAKALQQLPSASSSLPAKSAFDEDEYKDDPILAEVLGLLALGSSGIILRGAPGTSKSWYAWNIALRLTNNTPERVHRLQFHPSYGYEDFVEGYMPNETSKSGFSVDDRIFLKAVKNAWDSSEPVVFIIDEINRGDTSRIFGEVLTYIEHGWRNVPFHTKLSGNEISIPKNLVVLATMNPHDRSITQLDMALLRRFDHIDISPSRERASQFMLDAGMSAPESNLVSVWFSEIQKILPFGIGHAYFLNVGDVGRLGLVWRYRILPFCESILEFEPDKLDAVKRSFEALDMRLRGIKEE